MALLDVGRVCRKTCGNDAFMFCVITGKVEGGFEVVGADGGKKKASGSHLEPTHHVVSAKDPAKELARLKIA